MTDAVHDWLDRLGYAAEPAGLHLKDGAVPDAHPYALEIKTLLKPDGAIRAQAVFDVEGVPTVVFVGDQDQPLTRGALDEARKRIWNQNLATVVIDLKGEDAVAFPVRKLKTSGERLSLTQARPDGPFSALDVATANLSRRMPKWFDMRARVDRQLLANLSTTVAKLTESGFDHIGDKQARSLAELLMGQILFISYLEHREIVGATYRERRGVDELRGLIVANNRIGLRKLIDCLRRDFNGDFLGEDRHNPWASLNTAGFELLTAFLQRTDMRTGQGDFWNYDFSYIPVELLSGLYEKFLSPEQQAKDGAYYTPRNLAMLAVEQAILASDDPLNETVFDGACGSGILLTTAYRRLIALSEARDGKPLDFAARGQLLKRSIFGADINQMACRVTAFSLYLSLLEGLNPKDILEAQEKEDIKLPTLSGSNLIGGAEGDFFSASHAFISKQFSLVISNPPWAEPSGADHTSADDWALSARIPHVRRQIAGAYALRAINFLNEDGCVCLILPIGQFLGPSSGKFVSHALTAYKPTRLINFGDLQGLLFPSAENTCHIFVAQRRRDADHGRIPPGEMFEYLVPKADLSLALGRLTMQSADRHWLQTRSVAEDPQLLVTMMWGDANDLSIWTRLSIRGTFGDFWRGSKGVKRWTYRKGIHLHDKSRTAEDAGILRSIPYLPIAALSAGSPTLHPHLLMTWPVMHDNVVGLNEAVLDVFDGPRVMFPDGFSKEELNVRSVFYDGPATFTHSVGVIKGPNEDAALLRFAAAYLRSSLARYFLMMRGWKMLCERNGIHLSDIESFPFFGPGHAPDPGKAAQALELVSSQMQSLAKIPELEQLSHYHGVRAEIDAAIFAYFGLSDDEQALIKETVEILLPSVRPRSFKSLDTRAQHRAGSEDLAIYANALAGALTTWRTRTNGRGRFTVDVVAGDPERAGPSGIVKISYSQTPTRAAEVSTDISDELVLEALAQLRRAGLRAIPSGEFMTLLPDTNVWIDGSLYLVRPLTQRTWTRRQALRDAKHIVKTVQAKHSFEKVVA